MTNPDQSGAREVAPTLTTTEARSGVTGHNVRYVLVWGTGMAIVAMVIVGILGVYVL